MEFTNPGWKMLAERPLLIPAYLKETVEQLSLLADPLGGVVTEFLRGTTLGGILGDGPISAQRTLYILRQVCDSLAEAALTRMITDTKDVPHKSDDVTIVLIRLVP